MSRIAGLVYSEKTTGNSQQLSLMLNALSFGSNWKRAEQKQNNAEMGWTGWLTPNVYAGEGLLVAFDGSLYNREEFGNHLSDAESIAILYRRYGFAEMLRKVNGDFAIALYDISEGTLWLARDRFGVKPLYYAATKDCFAFASQPRALFTVPGVTRQVNRKFVSLFAASHYRYFDNNPQESPYADIAQLPAAHYLRLQAGSISKNIYWSLEDLPEFTDSESQLAERYRDLFFDAVSLRFESAKRPAFTLSGGMDSSSVLASAVQFSAQKQHAFSTVYSDSTYDESREISSMLDTKVERWHPVKIDNPDVFNLVEKMVAIHDEPVATATWLSHFILCQDVATEGFGGLFGGLGGDELNAGEYEYFFFNFADLRAANADEELKREMEMWVLYHDHPIFHKNQKVMDDALARLVDANQPGRCLPDRRRLTRYYGALNHDYFEIDEFSPVMDHPFRSYLKNRTYQDIFRETAPCCLRAEDRQTMAFGLDNFLPFFDYRVVEFMFRIPGRLKIRDGVTKYLLREAMRGILPEETRTRVKKTGWNAPAHVWFSGTGRDQLLDLIHSRQFRERGIYKVSEVERIISEHEEIMSSKEPRENHMMFLWQLVNLETWLASL
jgi:asparagine synthase (glutamine-hydrolysing)